ncbi:hypothetical protein [Microbulbifer sp. VAAF005]|uniref:hypothetical protein n=1 Tax=Microbulbifer sp. VAAF005 TaxID=3034230 RepID=UPI0024AE27DF|nr:hypothetical protein [Microbulbifer sp. VAAF005]WHI47916.1 hypothetical protein P0078_05860 [Microbulbifer sp. VAAF005]
MKNLDASYPMHSGVLKNSIAGIALICAPSLIQADTLSSKIDLGEAFPFRLEDGVDHEVDLDISYQFDNIERVCVNTEVKDGDANSAVFIVEKEFIDPDIPWISTQYTLVDLLYNHALPTPDNSNPSSQLQNFNYCVDENSLLSKNLLDGEGEIKLRVQGGYVELWDLELVVEGDVSDTQLAIVLDEPAEFLVPSYGGRVNYDASIRNLDSSQSLVTLEQWSLLTFPNGDSYPIHNSRDVVLNYSETKDYTRNYLTIPEWFEAGDYGLTWYVTNPSTGARVKDSLYFTKSAD